jgi:hypothetical protein
MIQAFSKSYGILLNRQQEAVNNRSNLNQGGSKMTQSNNDFELTNCPDPKCYICTMHKGGYPSVSQIEDGKIKINSHHKKKLIDNLIILFNWIEDVA